MSVVSSFMSFFVKIITFGALYTQQNKYVRFWILIFTPKELHVHCVQGLGDVLAWYLQQNKSHILHLDEIDDLYVWYYIQQCEFYGPLPNHLAKFY